MLYVVIYIIRHNSMQRPTSCNRTALSVIVSLTFWIDTGWLDMTYSVCYQYYKKLDILLVLMATAAICAFLVVPFPWHVTDGISIFCWNITNKVITQFPKKSTPPSCQWVLTSCADLNRVIFCKSVIWSLCKHDTCQYLGQSIKVM